MTFNRTSNFHFRNLANAETAGYSILSILSSEEHRGYSTYYYHVEMGITQAILFREIII